MYNNNKRTPWVRYILSIVAIFTLTAVYSSSSRFSFLDKKTKTSFRFKSVNNLIVIPVQVNNMELNLILDTGMRSIVLFGKKFSKKLDILDDVTVHLSGYGKKKNRPCKLSIGNEILIADVIGRQMGIVVMPDAKFFSDVGMSDVDGIIGYEIFSRFIVKIDYPARVITLYEPTVYHETEGFEALPLVIKDTKPYINAKLKKRDGCLHNGFFHVDTGSAQDILLFLDEDQKHSFRYARYTLVGKGIGGKIKGFNGKRSMMHLGSYYKKQITPKYVKRGFSNRELQDAQGSIGSGFFQESVIILDYINMLFYLKMKPGDKPSNSYFTMVKVDV